MSKYHAVSSGMVTRQALPSITRQRGTTTGSANLMLYGAGKTTVSNNTTFIDSSANAFTITNNGSPVQSGYNPFNQPSSGAGTFNGSTDYLTAPASANFSLTGDFTVECWVWIDSTITSTSPDGNKSVALFSGFGASGGTATFSVNGSTTVAGIGFGIYQDSPSVAFNQTVSVPLNAWNHVAFTRSGTTVYGFLNGVRYTLGTSSATIISSASPVAVGRNQNTSYFGYCKGYISNARVVKGTAVYTSNFTPPTSPLTAITNTSLLLLTDNYSIVNSTATNLPVTINGNTTISTAQFPTGMSSSMYFDGVGDYATTATNSAFAFGTGAFTVECYFYRTANATNNPAIFCATTNNLNIFFNNAGDIGVYTITNFFYTSANTALNTWYHFAIVRESSQSTKIYLNGTAVYTFTETNNYATMGFIVANGPGLTNDFKGYISNMRVCKGTALYTANFTPPSLPMSTTVTVPNFVTNNIYGLNQIP
jgi:hypothetical protein